MASIWMLYVGRASVLRSRVASYWSDLRDRDHLAPLVARVARIEAVSCDSVHEAAWLERNLLEASPPPWNRTPGGQESAVYIRMDAGPVHPGLSVAYQVQPADRVRYFGPYLGGLKVRQAVAPCTGSGRCAMPPIVWTARNVTWPGCEALPGTIAPR